MDTWDSVADVLAGGRTGQRVRLRGWVHRQRSAGKMAFVVLRDGTGTIQCTVKAGIADDGSVDAARTAAIESSVSCLEGTVVADDRAPGGYEVKVDRFLLHQRSADFPLRGEQGTQFELDNRHLWLRSTQLATVLRVKHRLYFALRQFFDAQDFTEVDPSVITTNACEGGSTLFTFDYFGQTAYLSQSAQMYLEGCIFGNPKVYSVTPSFRAEKSRTPKHLTEFHHLEAEAAWWTLDDNIEFQERLVTHLAHDIATHCADDLRQLGQDPARLLRVGTFVTGESAADRDGHRFGRMTYHDAAAQLRRMGFDFPDGQDFGVPHEKALTEGRTNPLFVTHWPARIKAFYMHRDPDRPDVVACADMLGPDGFGELVGGSQRSEDIQWMRTRLIEQWYAMRDSADADERRQFRHEWERVARTVAGTAGGLENAMADTAAMEEAYLRPYEWYFDLRRYGSVPHAGFGLGVERLLRWFTGQEHIRDMLPYPRTPSRAYP